ncbi:spore maturation protein A [Sedimentibacter acidaminivorans]|uniref:Spore maturation protein A n=1 Tax=Sedimentibacter acidaminivorans TaxID=913099 RepID=A0ABS4GET4_9FIRM|nr:spore maturation protein A [Sedimentibacter acidaminivorans]
MKKVWFGLISIGILFSFFNGKPEIVSNVILYDLQKSVDLILSLVSIMAFWSGLMRIVEKSGILNKLSKIINPVIKILFSDIQNNTKAINAVIMCIAANMFGIGNSATALGIKAMEEMQKGNKNKNIAMNSMCMLLVINMSSIQLIPLTIIKMRADAGAVNPNDIILPTIVATTFTTIVAIIFAKYYERKNI